MDPEIVLSPLKASGLCCNPLCISSIAWPLANAPSTLVKWILQKSSTFSFPIPDGRRKFRGKQVANIEVNELANIPFKFG